MESYLQNRFPDLKIQKPLFYSWPIGIRYEIGPENIALWQDQNKTTLNEVYFQQSLERAIKIFERAFQASDDIAIIYQQYSDGRRRIRKRDYVFKQVRGLKSNNIIFSDVRNIYKLEFKSHCWKRAYISKITVKDINYKNIFISQTNTDFSTRIPSMSGECFFINMSKDLILNLYDDRGMDVIATSPETLRGLYSEFNEWILDYDRDQIDKVFS